jgi:hypothetical protein
LVPVLLTFGWFSDIKAQPLSVCDEDEVVNMQIWLDYNPSWTINNRMQFYGDLGVRTIFPKTWYRAIVRPSIRYDLLSYNEKREHYRTWEVHGGMGFFYTYNLEQTNILEVRPFQGLRVHIPNSNKFQLIHYFRLEERWEIGLGSNESAFSVRARYMLGNDFSLPGKFLTSRIYIPVYVEFFFNLSRGAQFNDVIRLTPGLGYTPNQNLRYHFDLSYYRTRDTAVQGFSTNDIVFRLRVCQRL